MLSAKLVLQNLATLKSPSIYEYKNELYLRGLFDLVDKNKGFTIKPVYNDHLRNPKLMAVVQRSFM
jgi:hypothetical protein